MIIATSSTYLLLLLLITVITTTTTNAQEPVLQSKWDLPRPDLFFCDTGEYVFRFDTSTVVENYMVSTALKTGDTCDVDIGGNSYLMESTVFDGAPVDSTTDEITRVRQVAFVLEPDYALLGNSPVYTVSDDGSTGTIQFCVLFEIYLPDNTTRVNWREITYSQITILQEGIGNRRRKRQRRLDVVTARDDGSVEAQQQRRLLQETNLGLDCQGPDGYGVVFENWWAGVEIAEEVNTFNISYEDAAAVDNSTDGLDVMVGPALVGSLFQVNASYAYELDAYECDELLNPIVLTEPYVQGSIVRICISPDTVALEDGMTMRNVETLQYSKSDDVANPYYAVFGGQTDFLGFSEMSCVAGTTLCYVETLLKADWFRNQGFVEVTGVATLQFGQGSGSGRRRLQQEDQDQEELGNFVLNFPISKFIEDDDWKTSLLNGGSYSSSNGISMTQSVLLIAASFALIVECIFLVWIRQSRKIAKMAAATSINDYDDDIDDNISLVKKNKKKPKKLVESDDDAETKKTFLSSETTTSHHHHRRPSRPRKSVAGGLRDSCTLVVDNAGIVVARNNKGRPTRSVVGSQRDSCCTLTIDSGDNEGEGGWSLEDGKHDDVIRCFDDEQDDVESSNAKKAAVSSSKYKKKKKKKKTKSLPSSSLLSSSSHHYQANNEDDDHHESRQDEEKDGVVVFKVPTDQTTDRKKKKQKQKKSPSSSSHH